MNDELKMARMIIGGIVVMVLGVSVLIWDENKHEHDTLLAISREVGVPCWDRGCIPDKRAEE